MLQCSIMLLNIKRLTKVLRLLEEIVKLIKVKSSISKFKVKVKLTKSHLPVYYHPLKIQLKLQENLHKTHFMICCHKDQEFTRTTHRRNVSNKFHFHKMDITMILIWLKDKTNPALKLRKLSKLQLKHRIQVKLLN